MMKLPIVLLLAACAGVSAFSANSCIYGRPTSSGRVISLLKAGAALETDSSSLDPFDNYAPGSDNNLAWKDLVVGQGEPANEGDVVVCSYTGLLFSSKKQFDKADALTIKLGGGKAMPGFEKGMAGIREGTTRVIRIPPSLAYGEQGRAPVIPPNSDLEFEVQVTRIARGPLLGELAMFGEARLAGLLFFVGFLAISPMLNL